MLKGPGKQVAFPVYPEGKALRRLAPWREVKCDNDDQSEEEEINGAVQCMSMSLSLASFDHLYV